MAAEARVEENLVFGCRGGEFQEEDLGGEVVDLGEAEGEEGGGEFVGYYLDGMLAIGLAD